MFSWKKPSKRRSASKPEGAAEKLLQYADAHPSERELAHAKIRAELKRWSIQQRPPTVQEIQQRYNYTAEFAGKFLKKLEKARSTTTTSSTAKHVKPLQQASMQAVVGPVEQKTVEANGRETAPVQMKAILADIRLRYGDEIRTKGEQTSAMEGFVYLVTNPCYPGWVKAGMTIDYELRLGTYNTSDPLSRFEYAELAWTPDRRGAERQLLESLQGIAIETRGEWFRMRLQDAQVSFDPFKRMR